MCIKDPSKAYPIVSTTGILVSIAATETEANAEAKALAAKRCGEAYLVCKPLRMFRQKPVDIETVRVK